MKSGYDFSGWASRYDVPCSDGRTIRKNAFKDMDGQEVTLTWGHEHGTPITVLGKALIEHRDEGPYIYGSFNNTEEGQHAKEAVRHGDVKYLSIFANHLKQQAGNVMHGVIREVSIVYGGANPGAYIDHAVLAHSDGTYEELSDEAIIRIGGEIDERLEHADSEGEESNEVAEEDNKKETEEPLKDGPYYKKIFDDMTEDQKAVCGFLMEEAVKDALEEIDSEDDDENEEDESVEHSDEEGEEQIMAYNAFENNTQQAARPGYISHSDQGEILKLAKNSAVGTWKNAIQAYIDDNELSHDDVETNMVANGFDNTTALYPTMSNNPADAAYTAFTAMLPEFKDVRGGKPPELIDYDDAWVSIVMNKTNKLPFSRIRTSQIDIRNAEMRASLRAKGYQKGHKKTPGGNLKLARRTTDPQTVYVKNELHRDDITDITDFDYVNYLYQLDMKMLKEELATAILFGDGRDDGEEDKIFPEHIRPIWTDDELYTRHIELDIAAAREELQGTETDSYFGDNYIYAEAMINTLLYGREDHLGTGTPDLFITDHMLNVMLLARDRNGRRIYANRAELAAALNVGTIVTAKQFENRIRTDGNNQKWKMVCMLVNLSDYSVGHTKGGEIAHFTQFDIDFNKQKSLIETRLSGALARIQSAMVIEEKVTNP